MLKKCSGIILSLIIACTMSITAFAEITVNTEVKVDENDNSYTLIANAADTDNGTLSYQWYECDANGGGAVAISEATGNVYQPSKAATAKYYFCAVTSTTEAGANTVNSGISEVAASVEAQTKELYTLSVNGISKPKPGNTPETTAAAASSGYTVTAVTWDPQNSEFQPETVYTVTVTIKLDDNCKVGEGFTCLIDNNEAVVSGDPSTGEFSFYYTFPATATSATAANIEAAKDAVSGGMDTASTVAQKTVNKMNELSEDLNLPSPLGIPGWIWVIIIFVILLCFIISTIAHSRAKKREKNHHNYLDEIYEEKMAKKREAEEKKKAEEAEKYSDDEEYDEKPKAVAYEKKNDKKRDKKRDKKKDKRKNVRRDDNNVSFYNDEGGGFVDKIEDAEPAKNETGSETIQNSGLNSVPDLDKTIIGLGKTKSSNSGFDPFGTDPLEKELFGDDTQEGSEDASTENPEEGSPENLGADSDDFDPFGSFDLDTYFGLKGNSNEDSNEESDESSDDPSANPDEESKASAENSSEDSNADANEDTDEDENTDDKEPYDAKE